MSFSSPGDCPGPGIEPGSPVLQVDSLPLSHLESPHPLFIYIYIYTHTHTETCVSSFLNCRSVCCKLNSSLLLTLGLLEGPLLKSCSWVSMLGASLHPAALAQFFRPLHLPACPQPLEGHRLCHVQAQMLQQALSQFPFLPSASSFLPLGTLVKACRWAQI